MEYILVFVPIFSLFGINNPPKDFAEGGFYIRPFGRYNFVQPKDWT
jgi:hypothetical protein